MASSVTRIPAAARTSRTGKRVRSFGIIADTVTARTPNTTIRPMRFHENLTMVDVEAGLRLRIPVPVFLATVVNRIPLKYAVPARKTHTAISNAVTHASAKVLRYTRRHPCGRNISAATMITTGSKRTDAYFVALASSRKTGMASSHLLLATARTEQ